MASTNFGAGGTDAILRQLDTEAGSTSIEVTLYLPWGMATGITVPGTYFGHYVAHFFTKHDAGDIAGRLAVLEAEQDRVFIHLRKARCYVAGQLVTHDLLRSDCLTCRLGLSRGGGATADHASHSLATVS
jgi:hypothetical protein